MDVISESQHQQEKVAKRTDLTLVIPPQDANFDFSKPPTGEPQTPTVDIKSLVWPTTLPQEYVQSGKTPTKRPCEDTAMGKNEYTPVHKKWSKLCKESSSPPALVRQNAISNPRQWMRQNNIFATVNEETDMEAREMEEPIHQTHDDETTDVEIEYGPHDKASVWKYYRYPYVSKMSAKCTEMGSELSKITLRYLDTIGNPENDDNDTGKRLDPVIAAAVREIKNMEDFIVTIYNKSVSSDPSNDLKFWLESKLWTVGSGSPITIGATAVPERISTLAPLQCGGIKGQVWNSVNSYYQKLGAVGEDKVFYEMIEENRPMIRPGKICKSSLPIFSTTPDFLILTDNASDRVPGVPIEFEIPGSVVGVGEVKSSALSNSTNKTWLYESVSVKKMLYDHKPGLIKKLFTSVDPKSKARMPTWMKTHQCLFNEIQEAVLESIKWKMVYYNPPTSHLLKDRVVVDFDLAQPDNNMYPKLFTTEIGRQMLCEAMSILEYVNDDYVTIEGYFPSLLDVTPTSSDNGNGGRNSPRPTKKEHDDGLMGDSSTGGWGQEEEEEGEYDDIDPPETEFCMAFNIMFTVKLPMKAMIKLDKIVTENLTLALHQLAIKMFKLP